MQIVQTREALEIAISKIRQDKNLTQIGFIPTMGALHNGHISLINYAKASCSHIVASIFVNRLQFNNLSDFENYPITLEADIKKLEEAGCTLLFIPNEETIYPDEKYRIVDIDLGILGEVLEAKYRPNHFEGVVAVVKRLFELVKPDVAFFGQKDYQQWLVIKKLVEWYKLPVMLEMVKTQREESGLAMSSRNIRLTDEQSYTAKELYRTLLLGKEIIEKEHNIEEAKRKMFEFTTNISQFKTDYIDICSADTLQSLANVNGINTLVICIAGYFGEVRLIDNILVTLKKVIFGTTLK